MLLLWSTAPLWNPVAFPPVMGAEIGVSFSVKQTAALGLDWRATYRALLDGMGIRHFRLMSYWDLGEPEPGHYDFATLDEQIAMAAQAGADVTLAIGLRQPRWPECHQPGWAAKLGDGAWEASLLSYLRTVVSRYEHDPTVISWELENEYGNHRFATCRDETSARLQTELQAVRQLSRKPVWMSVRNQLGFGFGLPSVDAYGLSVYRRVYSTGLYTGYLTVPSPLWYDRLRANLLADTTGKQVFISELQLEPWPKTALATASIAEQNKTMDLTRIHQNMMFAREVGQPEIFLWGGEWWYWRKVHGDPSVWVAVRSEIQRAEAR